MIKEMFLSFGGCDGAVVLWMSLAGSQYMEDGGGGTKQAAAPPVGPAAVWLAVFFKE